MVPCGGSGKYHFCKLSDGAGVKSPACCTWLYSWESALQRYDEFRNSSMADTVLPSHTASNTNPSLLAPPNETVTNNKYSNKHRMAKKTMGATTNERGWWGIRLRVFHSLVGIRFNHSPNPWGARCDRSRRFGCPSDRSTRRRSGIPPPCTEPSRIRIRRASSASRRSQ